MADEIGFAASTEIFQDNESKGEATKPPLGEVEGAKGDDASYSQGKSYYSNTATVNPNDFFDHDGHRTLVEQAKIMEESDPHLFGLMQTRKLAPLSFERQVMGDGPEAEFVREVLGRIKNFDLILYQMLAALSVGFSVTEIVWNYLDGKVIVEDLKPRCQDLFAFDKEWNLKLFKKTGQDESVLPDKKFIVTTYMGEYGIRYGSALYQKVYWPWYYKKYGMKFWAIYTEKHASPTVIARRPANLDSAAKTALTAFVNDTKNHAGITVTPDVEIMLLEADRQGALASYETFLDWLKGSMAVAILGQPGTIEDSKVGSYAKVAAQDLVRQDLAKTDISMLESVINDYLIRWLVDWNFPNVQEYPKWKIIYEEKFDLRAAADIVQILVNLGVQVPVSYAAKRFGIPAVGEGEAVLVPRPVASPFGQPSPTFAEMRLKLDQKIFESEIKR